MVFPMNWHWLTEKKARLDGYRPLPPALVQNLEQWFLIELTYTSNAIEGNTLTRRETAVVVEKGLTVSGKSLVEHLEATNHAQALRKVLKLAEGKTSELEENDILNIHNTILKGIDDDNAGHYRSIPVRISGSQVVLPNYRKVPDLMAALIEDIRTQQKAHPVELAAEAHYKLVTVHPFVDGNGRTARLLMNLILIQNGYPPALIRKRDRLTYIAALEQAQLGGSRTDYFRIISDAVNRSLDIYLNAVSENGQPLQEQTEEPSLMRIGALAKHTGESNPTIRYWTKEGLLEVADTTASGYQLYSRSMIDRIHLIRELQSQRLTIKEIKAKITGTL